MAVIRHQAVGGGLIAALTPARVTSTWLIGLLFLCCHTASANKGVNVSTVEVMMGGTGSLPCDITPARSRDKVSLILWFKEDEGKPIYSVEVPDDGNMDSLPPSAFWSSTQHFGSRALFRENLLVLQRLRLDESGTYRCRVDFNEAQTRNTFVRLSIIRPVEAVIVEDEAGEERATFLGPYMEKENLTLTCTAKGGEPLPSVVWSKDRAVIDTSFHTVNNSVVNTLFLPSLSRSDLHSEVTCTVRNNNITAPAIHTLHLDMNLAPTSISIEGGREEMIVGREYQVNCTVTGSRPPPAITWYINSQRLEGVYGSSASEGAVTKSKLQFKPEVDHVGGILTCKASNAAIPAASELLSEIPLNITYAPRVDINLGKSISANTIYEGGDVYFDCIVKAKPPSSRITWIHNGMELRPDESKGILFTNYSLVLQKIGRERSGSYVCESSNRVGRGQSQEILLDVKYVPVCKSPQPMIYGVSKMELVDVLCEVEANPSEVEFRWTFNNSAELIRVPLQRPINNLSTSLLSYTPQTAMDYGTLVCTASNQVGMQKVACIFHIIMAVTPDPVDNCSVINKSSDSFHLSCLPGFDGGMNQTFHIVVREKSSNKIMYENSALDKPDVIIQNLEGGAAYLATITSYNKKGTSQANHMLVETLQPPSSQLVEEKLELNKEVDSGGDWEVGAGILAGILFTIFLITGGVFALRRRCALADSGSSTPSGGNSSGAGDPCIIAEVGEPPMGPSNSTSTNLGCPAGSPFRGSVGISPVTSRLDIDELSLPRQVRRKGILKKTGEMELELTGSDEETSDMYPNNEPDEWPLDSSHSLTIQLENLPPPPPPVSVRCEKDGLLAPPSPSRQIPVPVGDLPPPPPPLQSVSDLPPPPPPHHQCTPLIALNSANLPNNTYSLKRKKQESMV